MVKSKLTLIPVKDSDMMLLNGWLHKDYILKWYHDPQEWIHEVGEREGAFNFLNHFIVFSSTEPIGFCQFYDCFDAKEEWYQIDRVGTSFSLDYLIGEEAYLGKGYGKEIVKTLLEKIKEDHNPEIVIARPEKENLASCKTLLASGFAYDNIHEYYKLQLR